MLSFRSPPPANPHGGAPLTNLVGAGNVGGGAVHHPTDGYSGCQGREVSRIAFGQKIVFHTLSISITLYSQFVSQGLRTGVSPSTRFRLRKVGVQIINRREQLLQCGRCGAEWTLGMWLHKRPRNFWACPNGCNTGSSLPLESSHTRRFGA